MYNVVISFGNYPSNIRLGEPGPFTAEELGLKWLRHCATFSDKGMLAKYRLVLLLPRDVTIPNIYDPYLEAWGDKLRFDENSKVQEWPLGPNLVFQQVLWLYHYKKLRGPFLWCEPDCIPIQPRWLDDLFEEYVNTGRPFMGALVDQKNENGQHIPRHMTGNGIYPEDAHLQAPMMLEARLTPWDVFAAKQIMAKAHFTRLIQHEYRHQEIMSQPEMFGVLRPGACLFHTDKFGAIVRLLGKDEVRAEPRGSADLEHESPPAEVLLPPAHMNLDDMLSMISEMCRLSPDTRRKVAYYVLNKGIVNSGHMAQHRKQLNAAKPKPKPLVEVLGEPAIIQPPA